MAIFPVSPAQAAILGQRRPTPVATVNAPAAVAQAAPSAPAAVQALTGQTPAAPPGFIANPADQMLLDRANRPEAITSGVGLLGRLAALGVGTKLQRENVEGQRAAALQAVSTLPASMQPAAMAAIATGNPEQVLALAATAQAQGFQAGEADKARQAQADLQGERLKVTVDQGDLERKSREQIAADALASREGITTADRESRESIANMNAAIMRRKNEIDEIVANLPDNKSAQSLQSEFRSESKEFAEQADAMRRIEASATDPSPAGDLALIFNYMKVLDPGSTVREGEFANAQNSGSVPERTRALYNSIVDGTRLTDIQRTDFVNRAGRLFKRGLEAQRDLEDEFTRIAQARGVETDAFMIDHIGEYREFEPAPFTQNADGAIPPPPEGFVPE